MQVKIKNLIHFCFYKYLIKTNKLLKEQRKNPLSIPIIIISFNQLFYLKQLINFLLERKFENIIIIDNSSTYPPLLKYFEEIKENVTIEFMSSNNGQNVFFNDKELMNKYGKGYYVLTDADIVPNNSLPENFMAILLNYLDKYFNKINKVGFALNIDDIPDHFPQKDKVINWEEKFWKDLFEPNAYNAHLDTTFALYKPSYPSRFYNVEFYKAIRLAENFTSKHGGWYKDIHNLSDEDKYYMNSAKNFSSWNISNDGDLKSNGY